MLSGTPNSNTAEPTPSISQTASDLPLVSPEPTTSASAPVGADYWSTGFSATDVTDTVNKDCSQFEMCVFVQIETKHTCSTLQLDGTAYDAEDNEVDTFSESYNTIKAKSNPIIEFGTDAISDNEEYVELDDATCYK